MDPNQAIPMKHDRRPMQLSINCAAISDLIIRFRIAFDVLFD